MKRLLVILFLCSASLAAQTTPTAPTAPSFDTLPLAGGGLSSTYSINVDTTGYVTHSTNPVTNASELTSALSAADCDPDGYIINLSSTATFTGAFTLADKSCATGKYVIIQSSNLGACPTDGDRIDNTYTGSVPKIITTTNASGLTIADGQDNTIVRCVEIAETLGTQFSAGFISVGTSTVHPKNTILDQILAMGCSAHTTDCENRRGIAWSGENGAFINSYIKEIHTPIQDAQAIGVLCTPGKVIVDNNYLQASTENIMAGGTVCALTTPFQDMAFWRNNLDKDASWNDVGDDYWQQKNAFELKGGVRVQFIGNLIPHCWIDAQDFCWLAQAVNSGSASTMELSDFTVKYNRFEDAKAGVLYIADNPEPEGLPSVGFTGRALVSENLINYGGDANITAALFVANGGETVGNDMDDISVQHNTLIVDEGTATEKMLLWTIIIPTGRTPLHRYAFHNNIIGDNSSSLQVHEDCFINGVGASCIDDSSGFNNIVYNSVSGDSANFYVANATAFPVANLAAVGFVNTGTGNYRCNTGSICKNAALDGEDVGLTASGYNIMECLTGIALSGTNVDCSVAAVGSSVGVNPGVTINRGVTIQ